MKSRIGCLMVINMKKIKELKENGFKKINTIGFYSAEFEIYQKIHNGIKDQIMMRIK